ncbi:hypothetical protein EGO56_13165 [Pantoea vagans]|nr:hypothetical protein EGO56_13165 [Pantoea vagans]
MDKNAGSVFEQRNALVRQRAHLRDEVRNRAGRATRDGLSDFPICPCSLRRVGLTAGQGRLCQQSKRAAKRPVLIRIRAAGIRADVRWGDC